MIFQQTSSKLGDVRNWTNDGSSIPDWVRTQMSGDIASNGTLLIATPIGTARVHLGDVVIEHRGQLWSRSPGEVSQLIDGFETEAMLPIAAIGPGKVAQFGTKSKAGERRRRGGERKIGFRPPIGKMPSIEWVHTIELTVDQSYQRSRLPAPDCEHCCQFRLAPLCSARRFKTSRRIEDHHRWAASLGGSSTAR